MTRADEHLARALLHAAHEAAGLLMQGHRSRPHADEKGRADLVTEFDRRSEALLMARLAVVAPGVPIVAEEASGAADVGSVARRAGPVLYVDPLDGTTNFVHGHPFFCVSVGLALDGEPVVGAVVAPALGFDHVGWRGADGAGVALRSGEPCAPSPVRDLGCALVATGFPPQRDAHPDDNFASFVGVKRRVQGVRRCGSAALDLCLVADGTYDGYWERALHAWDVVGGAAIVLAAGGRVTDLQGEGPRYEQGNVVATNGLVHDALLQAIRAAELGSRKP